MGSYSSSVSNSLSSATDKRQVVSDSAIGLSTDGNGNFTNLGNYNPVKLEGSSINTTTLDGGAIRGAFDFANSSLSNILALAINRDREAAAAAVAVNDSANAAIMRVATQSNQANAAVSAEAVAASAENNKRILAVGAVAFCAWWLWGRK